MDVELSFKWMIHIELKSETEGLITAAQDQAPGTRYYSNHIIKQGVTESETWRMCHIHPETVKHIISVSQTRAEKYLNRHNQEAAQLHIDICKHFCIKKDMQNWYQHNPE